MQEVGELNKDTDNEEQADDESKPGILSRVGAVADAAKRQVSRSAEVMTGADIRRFEDFTEATTTAVVGVHRDQAELRGQVDQIKQSVNDVQAEVRERLNDIEQSVNDVQQVQARLEAGLTRVDESVQAESESRTTLFRWVIAFGAVAAAALALSIVAIVVGTL